MRTRTILRMAVYCGLAYAALSLAGAMLLAEGTLHPGRRQLTTGDETVARTMAERHDAELRDVAIAAADGSSLRAWSIRPRGREGRAVILLHGQSDNRMGMIGYAEMFLSHGLSVLMPDARAHGASGGELATYGLLESDDIRRWFEWLTGNERPQCVYGFAESMGAAQLLQALLAEPRFCAVAAESPFSSFREIAYDRIGQQVHTGPWLGRSLLRPVVEIAFGHARMKYKLNFNKASPETAVAATRVRVLLIHGQKDRNIPVRHARRIAKRNPAVILWEVPNTDHCGAINTAREEFEKRVIAWFRN